MIERYVKDYEGGCDSDPDPDTEFEPVMDMETEPVVASVLQSGRLLLFMF